MGALREWLLANPFFTSKVLPKMPRRLRWGLRTLYFAPLDLIERSQGRDPMVPPHTARFTGSAGADFLESGQELADAVKTATGLKPHANVLDIGSGVGRLAVPLTRFLEPPGSYDGIDVVKSGVDWCAARITPRFPHFRFTLADVSNGEYNPDGKLSASEYTLPYPDGAFDVVVLYSVFTHMRKADMARYVAEIARVLKPRGCCFATYALINSETLASMESGNAIYHYKHHVDDQWILGESMQVAELNIAYDEPYVRELFARYGLNIENGIHYGEWSGLGARSESGEPLLTGLGQDVVVGTKVPLG